MCYVTWQQEGEALAISKKKPLRSKVEDVDVSAPELGALVKVCLAHSAFLGFSKTRTGTLSITVIFNDDKEKFYVERTEDFPDTLIAIGEFLGDEVAF